MYHVFSPRLNEGFFFFSLYASWRQVGVCEKCSADYEALHKYLLLCWKNQLYIDLRIKQPQKLQRWEVTESNLLFSSGPRQMKTRWHFQRTTFKLNVSCIWRCNLKHHQLLAQSSSPIFSKRPSRPNGIHLFIPEAYKGGVGVYFLGNSSIFMTLVHTF